MPHDDSSLLLVVDDSEAARYAKTRILRQAGFEVLDAASGSETMRLVRERKPRLVVLDVNLPDVDGWEICRRIKESPATGSVLVLQMSASYVTEADTVRALEGGADGCLTEPVEPAVLIATVRALLRTRKAEDALRDAFAREQAARAAADAACAVAEQANRTKDEFLATLSHELRSPLGAILTWVTLLRAGRLDAERSANALESIERNTRMQVKLIEDLLDVSRIVSGKMLLERGSLDLRLVVEAALDSLRPAAEAKSIRMRSTFAPGMSTIFGDAARLQQVVWNLVSNAVKFTPKGGTVDVTVEPIESHVHITVSDTGQGIDQEFLPHIFERFRQADGSTTRREGGLGLGLAIVRHLVELHGGTVEAASEGVGKGVSFTVRLPLAAVSFGGLPSSANAALDAAKYPRLDGLRVLVVDDDADARDSIASVLEQCGARVEAVATAGDALRSLAAGSVHVVVSDIAMPSEDGFALAASVRALGRPHADVPMLALTACASDDERRRILDAGYRTHLAKPATPLTVALAVAELAAPERGDET